MYSIRAKQDCQAFLCKTKSSTGIATTYHEDDFALNARDLKLESQNVTGLCRAEPREV